MDREMCCVNKIPWKTKLKYKMILGLSLDLSLKVLMIIKILIENINGFRFKSSYCKNNNKQA